MRELYSEKDYEQISSQLKKRLIIMAGIMAVFLALFIFSMVIRLEWLSMVAFFLYFATVVFCVDLFCRPLHNYKKLISRALTGRNHTMEMEYKETEAEASVVDGVKCLGMIFLGEADRHGSREQRFYWDAELPRPDFRSGDLVTLKYTGRNIIGYQV